MTLTSHVITICLCGCAGVFLAGRFRLPVPWHTWVLLVLAVVVGSFVGVSTHVVSVLGFGIRLNVAIASCSVGILVGLWARRRKIAAA